MIQDFPRFGRIELSDRDFVESHTSKYFPYSDFNFTSLWVFDTRGEFLGSSLNDNLAVLFKDYNSDQEFYSFLGDNQVEETAEALFELSRHRGIKRVLRYIPESNLQDRDFNSLIVLEDRDNFDYILSIDSTIALLGKKYAKFRKDLNRFNSIHGRSLDSRILELGDQKVRNELLDFFGVWLKSKDAELNIYQKEYRAVQRFFEIGDSPEYISFGVYKGNNLIGFTVAELLPGENALSHFTFCDNRYRGLTYYTLHKLCSQLKYEKVMWLNYEQDCGVNGLRMFKQTLNPAAYLRKYRVTERG